MAKQAWPFFLLGAGLLALAASGGSASATTHQPPQPPRPPTPPRPPMPPRSPMPPQAGVVPPLSRPGPATRAHHAVSEALLARHPVRYTFVDDFDDYLSQMGFRAATWLRPAEGDDDLPSIRKIVWSNDAGGQITAVQSTDGSWTFLNEGTSITMSPRDLDVSGGRARAQSLALFTKLTNWAHQSY